jgi:hypothetical protein
MHSSTLPPVFGKGACLIFPGESQCRSMNAAILGQWNDLIRRGEARVGCFPVDKMKIPPLKGGKKSYTGNPTNRSCSYSEYDFWISTKVSSFEFDGSKSGSSRVPAAPSTHPK